MTTVTFYSPGTLVPETSEIETDLTDPIQIAELARGIKERHGATPFAFSLNDTRYWLGGTIMTLEDVPEDQEILRWNMTHNDIKRVIVNTNSWRHTAEFRDTDVLLEFTP